jgi:hypothetical protein
MMLWGCRRPGAPSMALPWLNPPTAASGIGTEYTEVERLTWWSAEAPNPPGAQARGAGSANMPSLVQRRWSEATLLHTARRTLAGDAPAPAGNRVRGEGRRLTLPADVWSAGGIQVHASGQHAAGCGYRPYQTHPRLQDVHRGHHHRQVPRHGAQPNSSSNQWNGAVTRWRERE